MTTISEKVFEDGIEAHLVSAGYKRRNMDDYDRARCLITGDVLDFIICTQPKEWKKLGEFHGADVKDKFIRRLASEIERRGALDVFRKGIKDSGCKFRLAYFHPSSGLNAELQRLYESNIFAVLRQLKYSQKNENSLDLGIFLNGIPIFTAELKTALTGQTVQDAMTQYKADRDPREPLLTFKRTMAHFALDTDLVYMTTRLARTKTRFLPFNMGKFGGAGNPPVSPTNGGYSTSYLWERIWERDSVLNLINRFIHEIEVEDEDGKKTGATDLIFPRYHQLDCVRRIIADARENGPGKRYLVQHSAGSGKSNSIAWLAHQLSTLHDDQDRRVFDSIIVITDRKLLDRQLQKTIRQFEQTDGLVENIDKTSRQLKEALESGKTIIVSTLQKFPVIADQIGELEGSRFALIIDEAHSSQSGESTRHLKRVLADTTLEEAEKEDEVEDDTEDKIVADIKARGPLPNLSMFAFTATPKPKTLELFGTKREDGKFEAFSLYTMRQAIEEGFILDVLENYTTYDVYWKLLKTIKNDPKYDKEKANYLLRSFVGLHEHAIRKKLEIMVEHFHEHVSPKIAGKAKAMIVTSSRLHAVRYKIELDKYLAEQGYKYKTLVAFSGTVKDSGKDYTESNMNGGLSESQTANTFRKPEYRFLVVANKFQTGFDESLLHTMYVDKKLGGVNAVQTLSRLNRIHPPYKADTSVLDFINLADQIQESFEPFYEKTLLSEATDPNTLYDLERQLGEFHVYEREEIERFTDVFYDSKSKQDKLYSILKPGVDRYIDREEDERVRFRSTLKSFVSLYSFLSQILPFTDTDLEKLYIFGRLLLRYLPVDRGELPDEIKQNIDMESFRIQRSHDGQIKLARGGGGFEPIGPKIVQASEEVDEPLSQILNDLNERFGTDFTESDKVIISNLEESLVSDESLATSVRVNTPESARLTFDQKVTDRMQDIVDTNFDFYKRVTDDNEFSKYFRDWLFDRFSASIHRDVEQR